MLRLDLLDLPFFLDFGLGMRLLGLSKILLWGFFLLGEPLLESERRNFGFDLLDL